VKDPSVDSNYFFCFENAFGLFSTPYMQAEEIFRSDMYKSSFFPPFSFFPLSHPQMIEGIVTIIWRMYRTSTCPFLLPF